MIGQQLSNLMKRNYWFFIFTTILVYFCVQFLDKPIAIFFKHMLTITVGKKHLPEIPDLLSLFVVGIVSISWSLYFYLHLKQTRLRERCFFKNTGLSVLLAYVIKEILKFGFGRINTRVWLYAPHSGDFQWFNNNKSFNGFPSGHMTIFTALLFVCWQSYPQYRYFYIAVLLVIGSALVITDYHFLSDVIAGSYVGYTAFLLSRTILEYPNT